MSNESTDSGDSFEPLEAPPLRPADEPGAVFTPMGQVDSIGVFARGLGARRLKIALVIGGALLILFAVIAAL